MNLSPSLVQQMILAEHVERQSNYTSQDVCDIFHYGSFVGHVVEVHDTADRCMDLARQAILHSEKKGESFRSGSVVIASELTGGKGRFQRAWHAPKGGVWLAVCLVNTLLPDHAALLSLAAGVSCCEVVRHYGIPAHIKWVNDVHVNGLKLAGILAETMRGPHSGEEYILLGIGLNVNNNEFPDSLDGRAIGMGSFSPDPFSLSDVAARLVAKLAWNIGMLYFVEQKCLADSGSCQDKEKRHPLLDSWCNLSDTIGKKVRYGFNVISSPQYTAEVTGIDQYGALIMRLPDGSMIHESGGEINYL